MEIWETAKKSIRVFIFEKKSSKVVSFSVESFSRISNRKINSKNSAILELDGNLRNSRERIETRGLRFSKVFKEETVNWRGSSCFVHRVGRGRRGKWNRVDWPVNCGYLAPLRFLVNLGREQDSTRSKKEEEEEELVRKKRKLTWRLSKRLAFFNCNSSIRAFAFLLARLWAVLASTIQSPWGSSAPEKILH